jgi:hypothetical protein
MRFSGATTQERLIPRRHFFGFIDLGDDDRDPLAGWSVSFHWLVVGSAGVIAANDIVVMSSSLVMKYQVLSRVTARTATAGITMEIENPGNSENGRGSYDGGMIQNMEPCERLRPS